jgi:hypothetical protein
MAMKERPILFSGPMIRAILEGRKTQTRRIIKAYQDERTPGWYFAKVRGGMVAGWQPERPIEPYMGIVTDCPYGQPGDRLWVRETWCECDGDTGRSVAYRADEWADCPADNGQWRPSIFMPRWASRITLEVTGVRVERVQDISFNDALAEGMQDTGSIKDNPFAQYFELWDQINPKYNWTSNPWVWVVEFQRCVS